MVQEFPRSERSPNALLRTGEAMLALGLKDDARAIFQDVVKTYPKTPVAKQASAKLAEIDRRPKKSKTTLKKQWDRGIGSRPAERYG